MRSDCFSCIVSFQLHSKLRARHFSGPHFTVGKPRLREVRWLVQNHSGRREQSKDIILHVDFLHPGMLLLLESLGGGGSACFWGTFHHLRCLYTWNSGCLIHPHPRFLSNSVLRWMLQAPWAEGHSESFILELELVMSSCHAWRSASVKLVEPPCTRAPVPESTTHSPCPLLLASLSQSLNWEPACADPKDPQTSLPMSSLPAAAATDSGVYTGKRPPGGSRECDHLTRVGDHCCLCGRNKLTGDDSVIK